MFNPGDQVKFFPNVVTLNVTMTVRYLLSTKAGGENFYLCCYQDDNHTIQQIQASSNELQLIIP